MSPCRHTHTRPSRCSPVVAAATPIDLSAVEARGHVVSSTHTVVLFLLGDRFGPHVDGTRVVSKCTDRLWRDRLLHLYHTASRPVHTPRRARPAPNGGLEGFRNTVRQAHGRCRPPGKPQAEVNRRVAVLVQVHVEWGIRAGASPTWLNGNTPRSVWVEVCVGQCGRGVVTHMVFSRPPSATVTTIPRACCTTLTLPSAATDDHRVWFLRVHRLLA